MNRDDIVRMAREVWLCDEDGRDSDSIVITSYLERFANLVAAAEREKIVERMFKRSYATGHGDTTEDLLQELEWQVRENEREACAKLLDEMAAADRLSNYYQVAALRIRERGAP
jgi:hypothetical protein